MNVEIPKPKIGDYLYCGVCRSICGVIDDKWMSFYYSLKDDAKLDVYSISEDIFLSYDGCENVSK